MPVLPGCLYCQQKASKLLFYSKEYPSGKDTIESPIFSCESCTSQALRDLNICRGGIEGIKTYTFKQLGAMKEKEIGFLTAKRGKEINHLATKAYRNLLFSIHYQCRPSKKDILIDSLGWYKGNIEKRITEELDRRLSTLLDCSDEIIKDLKNGQMP